jgi:hypothetical protein
MFDFLVDIVPRDEIKPKPASESMGHDMSSLPSTSNTAAPSTSTSTAPASSVVIVKDNPPATDPKPVAMVANDQIQYYIQLAQQQQQQQQQQAATIVNAGNLANQLPQIAQQSALGSNIILAGPNIIQQQPQVMTLGAANQMQMQLVQLPSGEVAQIPMQQLQQICRQMQMPQQQPIIIQQPTMQCIQSPGNNIFLTQQQLQQLQNQQTHQVQQQQQHQIQLQNSGKQE